MPNNGRGDVGGRGFKSHPVHYYVIISYLSNNQLSGNVLLPKQKLYLHILLQQI
jgi:hypothetical protein